MRASLNDLPVTDYDYFICNCPNGVELVRDDDSSLAGQMWLSLALAYLPLLISLIYSGTVDPFAFLNPRLLYYTPALWDMTGSSFLAALLFETPFAILRGLAWLIFPGLICLCIAFAAKSEMEYRTIKDGRKGGF